MFAITERVAMNTPIQGTAADLIKLAMVKVDALLREGGFKTRMLLQVHDELVFEVKNEIIAAIVPEIKNIMENVCALDVPLVVEAKSGDNWKDMQKI